MKYHRYSFDVDAIANTGERNTFGSLTLIMIHLYNHLYQHKILPEARLAPSTLTTHQEYKCVVSTRQSQTLT